MQDDERLILMHKIQAFIKKKEQVLENLHIDFGYSLENLANGPSNRYPMRLELKLIFQS